MPDLITQSELTNAVPTLSSRSDLAMLISAASQAVEKHCGREFTSSSVTEYHNGDGLSRIWLRRFPVTAFSSLTVNGSAIASTDYTYNADTGELVRGDGQYDHRFASRFPHGTKNVVAVYTGGYATIPEAIKQAVIITVQHLVGAIQATGLFSSESIGDYSYTFNKAFQPTIPKAAEMLLASYVVIL